MCLFATVEKAQEIFPKTKVERDRRDSGNVAVEFDADDPLEVGRKNIATGGSAVICGF